MVQETVSTGSGALPNVGIHDTLPQPVVPKYDTFGGLQGGTQESHAGTKHVSLSEIGGPPPAAIKGEKELAEATHDAEGAAKDAKGAFSTMFDTLGQGVDTIAPIAAIFGVGMGLAETQKVMADVQNANAALNTAFQNTKTSLPTSEIQQLDQHMANLGHDDAETNQALAQMTTATGSAKSAMSDMNIVAELAAYKHISLTEAASMYIKASEGQARALKDLGIPSLVTSQNSTQALANAQLTLHNATTTLQNDVRTAAEDQLKYNDAVAKYGPASKQALTAHATLINAQGTLHDAQLTAQNDQAKYNEAVKSANDPLYQQAQLNKELEGKIKGAAQAQSQTFGGAVNIVEAHIRNFIGDVGIKLTNWFVQNQGEIVKIAGIIWNVLVSAFNGISKVAKMIMPDIIGLWNSMTSAIQSVVGTIMDFYNQNKAVIQGIAEFIAAYIVVAIKVITTQWSIMFTIMAIGFKIIFGILNIFIHIIEGIVGTIEWMVGVVKSGIGAVGSFIMGVGSAISGFFSGVANVVGGIMNAVVGVAKGIVNGVIEVINSIISSVNAVQIHVHAGPVNMDWNGVNIKKLPTFHSGGVVPGAAGEEVLALLQAGEVVTPASQASGGSTVYIDLRESKFWNSKDIDDLLNKLGKRLALSTVPRAGVKITRG